MRDRIYYDWFAERYVPRKDEYAAPERYTEVFRNENYFYAEKWTVKDEYGSYGRLHIAYSKEDLKYLQDIRASKEKTHKATLLHMVQLLLPPDVYEDAVRGMRKEE